MHRHFLQTSALLFCLAGVALGGYTIDPPVITIKASMGENMAWVDVVHTGGGPTAVEFKVLERLLTIDGDFQQANLPESRDFTVYPAQIVLQPNERARVQVSFNDRRRLGADRAYHLFSREVELPMDMGEVDGVRASVVTLTSYYTALNIDTGKPGRLTFVSSKMAEPGVVEVIVENRSNGRVQASNLVITVGGRERITEFSGRKNSIMPGQQRRFTFRYGRPVAAREVSFGNR